MDDAELVRAIEDNAAELLMAMGAAGGGRQRETPEVRWTIGGSPIDYHNAVVAADLRRRRCVIAESLVELKNHSVPGCWHVGPSMRPDDLGARLDRGRVHVGWERAGDGRADPGADRAKRRTGLEITRVEDDEALAVWEATLGQGFGEGEREARWVASVYRKLGYGDPWRHYLGLLEARRSRPRRSSSAPAWPGCTS